jgi:hypothetical protein
MNTIVVPPVAPLLPIIPTSTPNPTAGQSSTPASRRQAEQAFHGTAAAAFESYETTAVRHGVPLSAADGYSEPSALGIPTSDAAPPTGVLAIIDRIAEEWGKAGVDPAWIKIIKNPESWARLSIAERPAITKLGEALQRTGEFAAMRSQAVRILRGMPSWDTMLNERQAANPGIPRWRLDHQLVAERFGWREGASHEHVRTMSLIVGALNLADRARMAESPQSPPALTRV